MNILNAELERRLNGATRDAAQPRKENLYRDKTQWQAQRQSPLTEPGRPIHGGGYQTRASLGRSHQIVRDAYQTITGRSKQPGRLDEQSITQNQHSHMTTTAIGTTAQGMMSGRKRARRQDPSELASGRQRKAALASQAVSNTALLRPGASSNVRRRSWGVPSASTRQASLRHARLPSVRTSSLSRFQHVPARVTQAVPEVQRERSYRTWQDRVSTIPRPSATPELFRRNPGQTRPGTNPLTLKK